jgi:peptidoglycan/LPS O-acetylase OafA/YrhL
MYEVFAIAAGVVLGLVAQKSANTRSKVAVLVLGSVIVGAIVSIISGELLVSWAYLAFDAVQVLLAGCATVVLVGAWRRRATRAR